MKHIALLSAVLASTAPVISGEGIAAAAANLGGLGLGFAAMWYFARELLKNFREEMAQERASHDRHMTLLFAKIDAIEEQLRSGKFRTRGAS